MNFDYYFVLITLAVIASGALITLIADNNRLSKRKKHLWIYSIALLIPAALAEYFGVILNGAAQSTRTLHIFLKVFELSVSPVMVILLIAAINGFKQARMLIPVAAVNFILQVVTGFTGFLYFINENNVYCHNSFYWIYNVIYIICGMTFFRECIRFSQRYQNHNFTSLLAILIFLISGLSIHIVFSELRADWLTLAVASVMFYGYYTSLTEQTDSLTHLLDRKSYDNLLKSLNKQATVIMFDVDHFKEVNDTHGHDAGDVCLKTVASAILHAYKRYGNCFRIGGDEFCVITRRRADIKAVNLCFYEELNRLRKTPDIVLPNVSLGYSEFDPRKESIHDAVKKADTEMYKVKNKAR